LLHIIASLKSTGKGAVILPHGVLFRGNAEAEIRKNIIKKGLIKGIIGLPANLFYGTGIPACIIVIDKEDADSRKGIFIIDASKGYIKDGNKNRLRDQDIHKIVDVFNKQLEIPKYSRLISYEEIADPKNDYNLNIPRYIDSQEQEDIQDIEAHLLGGIPASDVDALASYWEAYPNLKETLFKPSSRKGYYDSNLEKETIKQVIFNHSDFKAFTGRMNEVFQAWANDATKELKVLEKGLKPKEVIHQVSESLLKAYDKKELVDKYDVYQHLLNYWSEVMQDDLYQIAEDGWIATPYRIIEKNKKTGKEKDKGWTCDLIPPSLMIAKYFANEKAVLDALEIEKESIDAQLAELEEEHSCDEGYFADFDKVNKGTVTKRLKELSKAQQDDEEKEVMTQYLALVENQGKLNAEIKQLAETLDRKALEKYKKLSNEEVKNVVVEAKWLTAIESAINGEMERISQSLTSRVKELIDRYKKPFPEIGEELKQLEVKLDAHYQGVMSQLLSPKDGWVTKRLGDVCNFYKGKGLPKSEIVEGGLFPCIHYGELFTKYGERIDDVISRTNREFDVFISKSNDVLMPTSDVTPNGLATASCIKKDNVILGGDILVIRTDENLIDGVFLSYFIKMNRQQIMQLVTGTTVYHLYGSDMAKFIFSFPEINEQRTIAKILNEIEEVIVLSEIKLQKLKLQKQAMINAMLKVK
jgi:type I restriction enzyme M protein